MGYMTIKYNHFTRSERNELSILLKKGYSYRDIAEVIGKDPSSISREAKHNSVNGIYDPDKAHHKAYVKRHYSKYQGMKISDNDWLERYVKGKLTQYWTPEEIAGRLEHEQGYSVIAFKSIYKWLYSSRGQAFCEYLPSRRYEPKPQKESSTTRTLIPDRIPIELRPNIINLRQRLGDFEADTLGVPRTSLETLAAVVDRKSRYFQARKIRKISYAISVFKELSESLKARSFTFDNGIENIHHQMIGVPTYFCDAYSSWQKPTIENTFQRLRRFIPKKSPIHQYSEKNIAGICDIMNNTPRKCLGWRTPKEVFQERSEKPTTTYQFIKNIVINCCT